MKRRIVLLGTMFIAAIALNAIMIGGAHAQDAAPDDPLNGLFDKPAAAAASEETVAYPEISDVNTLSFIGSENVPAETKVVTINEVDQTIPGAKVLLETLKDYKIVGAYVREVGKPEVDGRSGRQVKATPVELVAVTDGKLDKGEAFAVLTLCGENNSSIQVRPLGLAMTEQTQRKIVLQLTRMAYRMQGGLHKDAVDTTLNRNEYVTVDGPKVLNYAVVIELNETMKSAIPKVTRVEKPTKNAVAAK